MNAERGWCAPRNYGGGKRLRGGLMRCPVPFKFTILWSHVCRLRPSNEVDAALNVELLRECGVTRGGSLSGRHA